MVRLWFFFFLSNVQQEGEIARERGREGRDERERGREDK